MHLAIDIGNSRIKWARFSGRDALESGMVPELDLNPIKAVMDYHQFDAISVSSVVKLSENIIHFFEDHNVLMIDSQTRVPLKNNYGTPQTLGMDRLCAAIGAKSLFPQHPVLVIDIGTCVKYEFVTQNGVYEGGNISPGMQMRYSALNNYTSKLPALKPAKTAGPIGKSTTEALRLGVQQGILFEIQAMINTMETLHPGTKTIGTGGDLPFFVNDLKTHIFADLLLVLRGINEIYLHNAE
ncbi:MAG: type III pantothenate kinase [Flavobacteriales bacterium]|nr:type III pantothenate kinase [Flavobacteriales bacterium]MCB9204774.1 type III pantothenate kinase [Flavobacteriales bacterium]